jgi:quercetin dioxygenase-like cupin family protein
MHPFGLHGSRLAVAYASQTNLIVHREALRGQLVRTDCGRGTFISKIINPNDRTWIHEDVVGHAIDRCNLWYDGHDVSFSLVEMPASHRLSLHRHETWVAVYVVKGAMEVESDGGAPARVEAGGFYFVNPGEEHVETSLEPTTVMIIKAEPNIQYQIDADGSRRQVPAK